MIVGLGTDVVECERIRSAIERHGESFLNRVFTAGERAYCSGMADPVPHYAVRFAAKEAARKAMAESDALSWQEVEVLRSPKGPVSLRFTAAAEAFANAHGVTRVHVSLAHERTVAVATVVLESDA